MNLIRRKRETPFSSCWAPSFASFHDNIYISWIDRDVGQISLARTQDLTVFDNQIKLKVSSITPTALSAGPSGLLLAWVDPQTKDIWIMRSTDGLHWDSPNHLNGRTESPPRLTFFNGQFWLLWRQIEDNRLHLIHSSNGLDWQDDGALAAQSAISPCMIVYQDRLKIVWSNLRDGLINLGSVDSALHDAYTVYDVPLTNYDLFVYDDRLYLTWADQTTGQIHIISRITEREWGTQATLYERCIGAPSIMSLMGRLVLAWVRNDQVGKIHLALEEEEDVTKRGNYKVFHGDAQGYPTALDLDHHTPYPYLGIIVLPSDLEMPKGQTAGSLTAHLGAALTQLQSFWAEASYGLVDITYEVHPQVVKLPSPMSAYLVRARPKIIDGYGASFPVTFQGGETLVLEGSSNYEITVTFSQGGMTLGDIIIFINKAIEATTYNGPAEAKPLAEKSDIGQLRIQTTSRVDPGTILNIKGGTAVGLLGLDKENMTVYEGSKTQIGHLDLMLLDALKIVLNTKTDPVVFLTKFYGVVISLASNLGWYAIRANASMGPDELKILNNQKPFMLASQFETSITAPDVYAHETGHNLGLPDLYEEGSFRYVGAELGYWDAMDSNCFSHPSSWIKSYRSNAKISQSRWMKANNVKILDSTTQSIEVLLWPSELPFPANDPFATSHPGVPICHAIKIVFDENHAYFIENRQKGPFTYPGLGTVNYDRYIPGNGLLITDAVNDIWSTNLPRANVVLVHPHELKVPDMIPDNIIDELLNAVSKEAKQVILAPYAAEFPQSIIDEIIAAKSRNEIENIVRQRQEYLISGFYPVYQAGKEVILYQLPDGSGDIRVKILEVVDNTGPHIYKVKATWGRPGTWFDLAIRRWQNPPPYESPDIWIDSEENGWNTYEHHDSVLNTNVSGNPVLNGDRPWVGHENIVYARVWNHGSTPKNNVGVDFEVVVPPGNASGIPFDTDYINIPAGGYAIAKGKWRPITLPADSHGCIVAKVGYQTGELNANNNSAQENISDFYLEKGSGYNEVTVPFEFANPLPVQVDMRIGVCGLRPGWRLTVDPYQFSLEPHERMQGNAILQADESVPLEDREREQPAPIISLEAQVHTGCTWEPIGGFSMIAHTVRKSTLRVEIDPTYSGIYVSVHANTADGPIINTNVAFRLIDPTRRTIVVTRATTDADGRSNQFLSFDRSRYTPGSVLEVEVLLSPSWGGVGPAMANVQYRL